MNRTKILVFVFLVVSCPVAHATVTFEWATVGNPGNLPDQLYSSGNPLNLRFGAVDYTYRISKYEVTNDQYRSFLNAVDAAGTNPNHIFSHNMQMDPRSGIIFDPLSADGAKYVIKPNMGNKPVNYVSVLNAGRFVNWLENGKPTDGSGTEIGTYSITSWQLGQRASAAKYCLPTEDEWYKAAYHDPRSASEGGPPNDLHYWRYPTASDSLPTLATTNAIGDITNPGTNVANHDFGAEWNGQVGNVTTVGSAGEESASYYGTYDQVGNVWEFNETEDSLFSHNLRGGSWRGWDIFPDTLAASHRASVFPIQQEAWLGFRIASVPEPGSLPLAAIAGMAMLLRASRVVVNGRLKHCRLASKSLLEREAKDKASETESLSGATVGSTASIC